MGWSDLLATGLDWYADWQIGEHPGKGASPEEIEEYYRNVVDVAQDHEGLIGFAESHLSGDPESDTIQFVEDILSESPLMFQYLSGTGEDYPLSENQVEIDDYLGKFHSVYGEARSIKDIQKRNPNAKEVELWKGIGTKDNKPDYRKNIWYPSANPEFPAEEGWEFYRYDPTDAIMVDKKRRRDFNHPFYNLLGRGSIVRRKFHEDSGDYEYQIVEDWDVLKGKEKDWGDYYDDIIKFGKERGAPEFDYEEQRWTYTADFDPSNPDHFDDAVTAWHEENRFGLLKDQENIALPYLGKIRSMPQPLVDLAEDYFPDFAREPYEGSIEFWPSHAGWKYLSDVAEPFDITGTSYVRGE